MSDPLVVYAYNVLFGDGVLLEVPEDGGRKFILIDVGNVLIGPGSQDAPLVGSIDDVIARTGGHIALYIMTHEHLDHIQGLLHASNQGRALQIDTVWMTASSDPNYYDTHPDAKRKKRHLQQAVAALESALGAAGLPSGLAALFELNNARKTQDCVDHIRGLNPPNTRFLFRGADLQGLHPFAEASFRILAPEEDTSVYYSEAPAHLGVAAAPAGSAAAPARSMPLAGIDGGVFYELIDRMNHGLAESLFAIDKAENDSSLVVELTWHGRRLLFPGDAEQESWRMMRDHGVLEPVDLLKVGHHGSKNATPPAAILDLILPPERRDSAVAVLSTHPETYPGVPDPPTEALLAERTSTIFRTTDVEPGQPVVVTIEPAD